MLSAAKGKGFEALRKGWFHKESIGDAAAGRRTGAVLKIFYADIYARKKMPASQFSHGKLENSPTPIGKICQFRKKGLGIHPPAQLQ